MVAKVEGLLFVGSAAGCKAFGLIEGYQGDNTRVPIFISIVAVYALALLGVALLPETLALPDRRRWPGWANVNILASVMVLSRGRVLIGLGLVFALQTCM